MLILLIHPLVYPAQPRTYHIGVRGTFMTQDTHNKYFKDISYNTDASVDWTDPKLSSGHPLLYSTSSSVYEARIVQLISQCKHIRRVEEVVENEVPPSLSSSLPSSLSSLLLEFSAMCLD